jgi:Tol biopolymer transport system component
LQRQINLLKNQIEQLQQTTKDVSNIQAIEKVTETEKKIELNPDFLSSVLIMDGDDVKIKSLDKSGNFQNIKNYNRKLLKGSYAQAFYLNYEPTIFISSIGENGYTTIDLSGKETSGDNTFLKDKEFSVTNFIKFPSEDKIVYARGVGNQEEGKPIFILDYKNNKTDYVENDTLPNGLMSSRVIGWSKDKQFLYVTKIGWEGYEYAGLWKVDIQTKAVDEITGVDRVTLGALNVVPYLDLAVGIESQETTCDDCMRGITAGPPSKLNIFDLRSNSYKTLLTSNLVIDNPILDPDGNKIFYSERDSNNIYTININGSDKKLIAENASIQGISRSGEKIIIKLITENIYKILDLEKKSEEVISFPELKEKTRIDFMSCNYPLGYSCLY